MVPAPFFDITQWGVLSNEGHLEQAVSVESASQEVATKLKIMKKELTAIAAVREGVCLFSAARPASKFGGGPCQ